MHFSFVEAFPKAKWKLTEPWQETWKLRMRPKLERLRITWIRALPEAAITFW